MSFQDEVNKALKRGLYPKYTIAINAVINNKNKVKEENQKVAGKNEDTKQIEDEL